MAIELLERKFSSGNSVPVERVVITRREYELIAERIRNLESLVEAQDLYIKACEGETEEDMDKTLSINYSGI